MSTNDTIANDLSGTGEHHNRHAHMDALRFEGEHPHVGMPIVDAKVDELKAEVDAGEISLDDANDEALDTMINEVFGEQGSNNEHNND